MLAGCPRTQCSVTSYLCWQEVKTTPQRYSIQYLLLLLVSRGQVSPTYPHLQEQMRRKLFKTSDDHVGIPLPQDHIPPTAAQTSLQRGPDPLTLYPHSAADFQGTDLPLLGLLFGNLNSPLPSTPSSASDPPPRGPCTRPLCRLLDEIRGFPVQREFQIHNLYFFNISISQILTGTFIIKNDSSFISSCKPT